MLSDCSLCLENYLLEKFKIISQILFCVLTINEEIKLKQKFQQPQVR